MDFWDAFIKESLQSPWMVRPERVPSEPLFEVKTQKVFVIGHDLPDEAYEMLSKMILALKYDPAHVTVLSANAVEAESLQDISEPKNILFFGKEDFPGSFGEALNWSGHKIFKTHSLNDLLQSPGLKKETWGHLKAYAGLR